MNVNALPKRLPFVCLLGIDGCGKSSILDNLQQSGSYIISHWNVFANATKFPALFPESDPGSLIRKLPPRSRALMIEYLMVLQYENIILPGIERNAKVIADSYYFRFYTKEKIFAKCHPSLFRRLRLLPLPELIIYLNLKPEISFDRKEQLKAYEYYKYPVRRDFIKFQTQVHKKLMSLIKDTRYVILDADQPMHVVLNQVGNILEDFFIQR